jgi:hypothetical protein
VSRLQDAKSVIPIFTPPVLRGKVRVGVPAKCAALPNLRPNPPPEYRGRE